MQVSLLLLLATSSALPQPINPLSTSDLKKAEAILRTHVASVSATLAREKGSPFSEPLTVDGWAVVTAEGRLACQAHLVKGATEVVVRGPAGSSHARILSLSLERRVAHLAADTQSMGLVPATPSPTASRKPAMDVIALVSTLEGAGVVVGQLLELEGEHLEGNLRASLELKWGMPIFDGHLRWLGLARTVAWDADKLLFVPPELTAPNLPK